MKAGWDHILQQTPNKPPDTIHDFQNWGGNSGFPFPLVPQISLICTEESPVYSRAARQCIHPGPCRLMCQAMESSMGQHHPTVASCHLSKRPPVFIHHGRLVSSRLLKRCFAFHLKSDFLHLQASRSRGCRVG